MDTIIRFPYPQNDNRYRPIDPKKMDGDGRIEKLFKNPGGPIRRAQFVRFSNGGFTKWHYHTGEQILFAVKGQGFVELEGSKIPLQPGEHAYIPKNVRHRHGAIEGEDRFIHLAVTAGETHWEDSVPRDPQNELNELNQKILDAEEVGDQKAHQDLKSILAESFYIVRARGNKQSREDFLRALPENANLGRSAEAPEIQIYGDCAIYACRVKTLRKPDGTEITRNFWNTRFFIRENAEWRCWLWQVTEIPS